MCSIKKSLGRFMADDIMKRLGRLPKNRLSKVDSAKLAELITRERRNIYNVLERVIEKKDELGIPLQHPLRLYRVMAEMVLRCFSVAYHHKDQVRDSGEPYTEHLWGVMQNLIEAGFIEPELLIAGCAHDVLEDVPAVREGDDDMFMEWVKKETGSEKDMGLIRGIYAELNMMNFHLKSLFYNACNMIGIPVASLYYGKEGLKIAEDMVKSVTKPRLGDIIDGREVKTKDDVHREYLRILLNSSLEDIRPILIKIMDRLHNMETLDVKCPEKQKRTAGKTLEVYVALAGRLGLFDTSERLLRLSLKYLNIRLIHDYDEVMKARLDSFKKEKWQDLQKLFHGFNADFSIIPAKLIYYVNKAIIEGKKTESLALRDLNVPEYDIVLDIDIILKEEEDTESMVNNIGRIFPEAQIEKTRLNMNRGVLITLFDAEKGFGKLVFRINSVKKEAMSKRGYFQNIGNFNTPDRLKEEISEALRISKEKGEDIRSVAGKEVLCPHIKVTDYLEGTSYELSSGSNVYDFLKDHYLPMNGYMNKNPFNFSVFAVQNIFVSGWEAEMRDIGPLSHNAEMPNNHYIIIEKNK